MSNAKCTKSGEMGPMISFRILRASPHIRDRNTQTHYLPYQHSHTASESLHRRKQATGVSRRFRNEDGLPRHLISLEILGDVSGLDRQGRKHTAPHLDEWPLSDQTRLRFSDSILPSARMSLDCSYSIGMLKRQRLNLREIHFPLPTTPDPHYLTFC